MRKLTFCICEKRCRSVRSLYFLNPKFQASIYSLWLYSPFFSFLFFCFCFCFCLTSRSSIFQSFWGGATASCVFTSTLGTLKCLAQGHYTAVVGFEHWTSRSGVRSSTTEPPRPHSPVCVGPSRIPRIQVF